MSIYKNILAAFFAAAACCYGWASENPRNSGRVTLTMPDGSRVVAELALTPQAQARGLMFRENLPDNEGMIFVFKDDAGRTFWMKNTYITLDIVFLDGEMRARNIFHRVPCSNPEQPEEEVAKVSAPARFVLELAAGRAKKAGLKPGSLIKTSFPLIKNPAAAPSAAAKKAVPPKK